MQPSHMNHNPAQAKRVLGYRKTDGRWQKKINGTVRIFGSREDAVNPKLSIEDRYARAMKEYEDFMTSRAGGLVKVYDLCTLTVRELANRYLDWMDGRVRIGEVRARTYLEVKAALQSFAKIVGGGDRLVATLGPEDFNKARIQWQEKLDLYTLSRNVAWVRSWLIWADDEDIIEHRPKFGKMFKRAGIKALRERMVEKAVVAGDKALTPAEVRAILPELGWEMKAPFLLGLNCAFYAEDVSDLCLKHLDLKNRVHWLPRGKNGNFRVGYLWDITVEAIEGYIHNRWRSPSMLARGFKLTADTPIFVTKYRNPFVHWTVTKNEAGEIIRVTQSNNGTKELNKVLNRLHRLWRRPKPAAGGHAGEWEPTEVIAAKPHDDYPLEPAMAYRWNEGIKRQGVSFGCLRHTCLTQIDDLGKEVESALLAGHKRAGVIEFYVRKYSPEGLVELSHTRIQPVVEHLRRKLGI